MIRAGALFTAALCLSVTPSRADALLTDTHAFEQADAASFFDFDACGDGLSGEAFRQALREKFARCPFDPAARTQLAQRLQMQQSKSKTMLAQLIDQHSGLPVQLDGMVRTCHAQRSSPEYERVQTALRQYGDGQASAESILPEACDAAVITP